MYKQSDPVRGAGCAKTQEESSRARILVTVMAHGNSGTKARSPNALVNRRRSTVPEVSTWSHEDAEGMAHVSVR